MLSAIQISKLDYSKVQELRLATLDKDAAKAKDYVHWCAWRSILNNNDIEKNKKFFTFKLLLEETNVRITFDG